MEKPNYDRIKKWFRDALKMTGYPDDGKSVHFDVRSPGKKATVDKVLKEKSPERRAKKVRSDIFSHIVSLLILLFFCNNFNLVFYLLRLDINYIYILLIIPSPWHWKSKYGRQIIYFHACFTQCVCHVSQVREIGKMLGNHLNAKIIREIVSF